MLGSGRSAPVPASIFGDDLPEAEDAPLPPLTSQPRLALGSQATQQASTTLPPQNLSAHSAQAPNKQQATPSPAMAAVHHHPLAPLGLEPNAVLGLGPQHHQGASEAQIPAETAAAEGDDDWGDEWVGSGSPAAAAGEATLDCFVQGIPRPLPPPPPWVPPSTQSKDHLLLFSMHPQDCGTCFAFRLRVSKTNIHLAMACEGHAAVVYLHFKSTICVHLVESVVDCFVSRHMCLLSISSSDAVNHAQAS